MYVVDVRCRCTLLMYVVDVRCTCRCTLYIVDVTLYVVDVFFFRGRRLREKM